MAEKTLGNRERLTLGDHKESLAFPVTAKSGTKLSARSALFPRFLRALVVLGIFYAVHSWVSRYNIQWSSGTSTWPVEAFVRSKHPILNGKAAERKFLEIPTAEKAYAAIQLYASRSHIAGSEQDLETAKVVLNHFYDSFGLERPHGMPIYSAGSHESRSATLDIKSTKSPRAWIDKYYPVLDFPKDRSLQITDDSGIALWTADIEEDGDPLDEDAARARLDIPVYHGLSKDGDVTGKLIYANYGRQQDLDELERAGNSLIGKVVLVRYGGIFRGLKVKGAAERGAVGVLIYSDPRDDGGITVENGYEAYPYGPARNPTSVQRGSVQYLSIYPGDPTTPGYPAYENSTRIEGGNIPTIPSLPISWKTAQRLFDEIERGEQANTVRLVNHVDTKVTPIWNTMAVIPGHIPDEVVVLGNHRDAWVLGAVDPSSGSASVHEVIRAFGELHKKGWKPLRTIVIASWDAEEYGLIGSTEYIEDFAEWVSDNVVAYVNLDGSVSGSRFGASGSPSLAHLIQQTALDVAHPTHENSSVWDALTDVGPFYHPSMIIPDEDFSGKGVEAIKPLGSGSDYTAFLQRIGIACGQGSFGAAAGDAPYHYHSIYDSIRFQKSYFDPGYERHAAVAKFVGLMSLRLADSIILPINTTHYTLELSNYVEKVSRISEDFKITVDFSPLRKSVQKLRHVSLRLDVEKEKAEKNLWRIIKRWQRRHRKHSSNDETTDFGGNFAIDENETEDKYEHRRFGQSWRRLKCFVKNLLGLQGHGYGYGATLDDPVAVEETSYASTTTNEQRNRVQRSDKPRHRIPNRLRRAIRRVQNVNKKLSTFEAGFISEAGIKDREWYRHLGVAPGKWLGYGATTLPALTESFTIEKNQTLAEYEIERLVKLIDALAERLDI